MYQFSWIHSERLAYDADNKTGYICKPTCSLHLVWYTGKTIFSWVSSISKHIPKVKLQFVSYIVFRRSPWNWFMAINYWLWPYSILLTENVIEVIMIGQHMTFAGLILFIYVLDFISLFPDRG